MLITDQVATAPVLTGSKNDFRLLRQSFAEPDQINLLSTI